MDIRNNIKFRTIASTEIAKFRNHEAFLYRQALTNIYDFGETEKIIITDFFSNCCYFLFLLEDYLIGEEYIEDGNIKKIENMFYREKKQNIEENKIKDIETLKMFKEIQKLYSEFVIIKIKKSIQKDIASFFTETTDTLIDYTFTILTTIQELSNMVSKNDNFISITPLDIEYKKTMGSSSIDKKMKIYRDHKKIERFDHIILKNYLETDNIDKMVSYASDIKKNQIMEII